MAQLDPKTWDVVKNVAETWCNEMDGRDYPRLDMRVRDGKVYVLEINNNPGLDFDIDSGEKNRQKPR